MLALFAWLLLTMRVPLQSGLTPLHCAVLFAQKDSVLVLLEAGADREAKDEVSREREWERGGLMGGVGGAETRGEERGCLFCRGGAARREGCDREGCSSLSFFHGWGCKCSVVESFHARGHHCVLVEPPFPHSRERQDLFSGVRTRRRVRLSRRLEAGCSNKNGANMQSNLLSSTRMVLLHHCKDPHGPAFLYFTDALWVGTVRQKSTSGGTTQA